MRNHIYSLACWSALLSLTVTPQTGCQPSENQSPEAIASRQASERRQQESQIQEVVFRHLLGDKQSAASLRSLGEVLFLGIEDNQGIFDDPPEDLAPLFTQEFGIVVKPVSQATFARDQPVDIHTPFYTDTQTGQAGRLFLVSEPHWIDDENVEVRGGVLAAPLAARSGTYVLQKFNDGWRIVRVRDGWVS